MDGNLPAERGDGRLDDFAPRRGGRGIVWGACGALAVVGFLARYALDLLPLYCVLVLLAHSVRDTFLDWASGEAYPDEPDPVWALWVVLASVSGTAFGLIWLISTSSWAAGTPLHDWLPPAVSEVATFAEEHGWGRRVVLPHRHPVPTGQQPPVARARSAQAAPPADRARTPEQTSAGTDDAPRSEGTAGTGGSRSRREPGPVAAVGALPARTSTALATSAAAVRVGSQVRLDARVAAVGGQPRGAVVFRSGARVIGSASLDDRGVATLTLANLPVGAHEIVAVYPASVGFQESRSDARVVVVRP